MYYERNINKKNPQVISIPDTKKFKNGMEK